MRLAELDEKEYQTAISIQEKKEKLRLVENVKAILIMEMIFRLKMVD